MKSSYLITIDIGTSSTKSALWHIDGNVVAESTYAYSIDRPYSTWAQVDPELWWRAVCITINQLLANYPLSQGDIAGIAVDGQGWAMIPIDKSGDVIFPALIWQDRRAEEEASYLRSIPEATELINLSANPLDAAYITPKITWLKKHFPDIFSKTATFLTASAYIVFRLTGKKICDHTQAYGYHFYDVRQKCWNAEAAEVIGVPLEKMPPLYSSTEIVGELQPKQAKKIGLNAGIPVIAGGLDASVGALGAGVLTCGQTVDQGGQAGGMILSVDHVIVEPQLIFGHHVLPGQYLLQSGTVGGSSLGWLKGIFNLNNEIDLQDKDQYEWLSYKAKESPPGANGLIFLPYMAGERTPLWDSDARGVFFGLSYKTNRADLTRSVMEGCAFAVYHNLQIALDKGVSVKEWLGDGGAADSDVWCQIKSDITNRPFIVRTRADGKQGGHTLGLFAMLTYALGLNSSMVETINNLLPNKRQYEPNLNTHKLYDDYFSMYLSISRISIPEFKRLSEIVNKNIEILEPYL